MSIPLEMRKIFGSKLVESEEEWMGEGKTEIANERLGKLELSIRGKIKKFQRDHMELWAKLMGPFNVRCCHAQIQITSSDGHWPTCEISKNQWLVLF